MNKFLRWGWHFAAAGFMLATMKKKQDTTNYNVGAKSAALTIDLTGLKCPLPVLKARRRIGEMSSGEVLVILADDPAAPLDFDHFCHTGGHQLLESTENDGVFTMRIAKCVE